MTKYRFEMPPDPIIKDVTRLTNQTWKLIPMRENKENWQKQLDTVVIEVAGLHEIFDYCPQFLQALTKLEGLKIKDDIEFSTYRKTVFEVINLLQEMKNG